MASPGTLRYCGPGPHSTHARTHAGRARAPARAHIHGWPPLSRVVQYLLRRWRGAPWTVQIGFLSESASWSQQWHRAVPLGRAFLLSRACARGSSESVIRSAMYVPLRRVTGPSGMSVRPVQADPEAAESSAVRPLRAMGLVGWGDRHWVCGWRVCAVCSPRTKVLLLRDSCQGYSI